MLRQDIGTTNTSWRRRVPAAALAALVAGLALAGCGRSVPSGYDENSPPDVRESMAAALRQCTIRYGYNPDVQANIPQNQLGAGEEDWRDCAHDALDRVLSDNLSDPDALEAFIDADEDLTEAIADGQATRAQRSAVLSGLLNNIRAREQQLYQQNVSGLSAGPLLDTTTSNVERERIRNDIESITRLL